MCSGLLSRGMGSPRASWHGDSANRYPPLGMAAVAGWGPQIAASVVETGTACYAVLGTRSLSYDPFDAQTAIRWMC